tara:strand:- start:1708 stop:2082 length:375 start_codon:yes stop_codon:yes gene_type:complete
MLAGGYSWRLFFYVEIAFAGALFIMAFIFVEETMYKRVLPTILPSSLNDSSENHSKEGKAVHTETATSYVPPRKSFLATLKPWSGIDHEAEFFMTMLRPFTLFFVPAVFWVITTYGMSSRLMNL